MEPIESEGRTVAEAVETALRKSGLRRDQVEITVTQEGSTGFMGLRASPAKVRLTEKRWGPDSPAPVPSRAPARNPVPRVPERRPEPRAPRVREEAAAAVPSQRRAQGAPARLAQRPPVSADEAAQSCAKAQALVVELLRLMAIAAATTTVAWDAGLERVKISVESQDAPLLIGREGRILESLQFLAALMLSRGGGSPLAVQVDALSYWEKREQAVLEEVCHAATVVKATGKPVRMAPMDASMRRLIHRTLTANPDVTTASEGEGPWRKVVIRPRIG